MSREMHRHGCKAKDKTKRVINKAHKVLTLNQQRLMKGPHTNVLDKVVHNSFSNQL